MIKKLALVLAIIFLSLGIARAEPLKLSEALEKLPPLKQGIAYSIIDNDFSYLSTLEVAKYKGFSLEAGYSSKDKVVGVISYEILKLKDFIDLPILNLVEFNLGLWGGYGRLNVQALNTSEWDAGISATLIDIKF